MGLAAFPKAQAVVVVLGVVVDVLVVAAILAVKVAVAVEVMGWFRRCQSLGSNHLGVSENERYLIWGSL